eukprot:scaffold3820_cov415-Prasinococcus_capsulatus_cf.AAC.5
MRGEPDEAWYIPQGILPLLFSLVVAETLELAGDVGMLDMLVLGGMRVVDAEEEAEGNQGSAQKCGCNVRYCEVQQRNPAKQSKA